MASVDSRRMRVFLPPQEEIDYEGLPKPDEKAFGALPAAIKISLLANSISCCRACGKDVPDRYLEMLGVAPTDEIDEQKLEALVSEDLDEIDIDIYEKMPTHVKIASAAHTILQGQKAGFKVADRHWEMLGIDPRDIESQQFFSNVMGKMQKPSARFVASRENPGVYFAIDVPEEEKDLSDEALSHKTPKEIEQAKPFAVFKIGEVRAQMESLARKVASFFGLSDAIAPGFMTAVEEPHIVIDEENPFEEITWDGCSLRHTGEKLYREAPSFVTGTLQPFVETRDTSLRERARLIIASIIIGMRDGKAANVVSGKLIDFEECFPRRLDPEVGDPVNPSTGGPYPATQFQYVDTRHSDVGLFKEVLEAIRSSFDSVEQSSIKHLLEYADQFKASNLRKEVHDKIIGLLNNMDLHYRASKGTLPHITKELLDKVRENIDVDKEDSVFDILEKLIALKTVAKERVSLEVLIEIKSLLQDISEEAFETYLRSNVDILYGACESDEDSGVAEIKLSHELSKLRIKRLGSLPFYETIGPFESVTLNNIRKRLGTSSDVENEFLQTSAADFIREEAALELVEESDEIALAGDLEYSDVFTDEDSRSSQSSEELGLEKVTQGNLKVIELPASNGDPFYVPSKNEKALSEEQIEACLLRFKRLQDFVRVMADEQETTLEDLLFAVDPYYKMIVIATEKGLDRRSANTPHTAASPSPAFRSISRNSDELHRSGSMSDSRKTPTPAPADFPKSPAIGSDIVSFK